MTEKEISKEVVEEVLPYEVDDEGRYRVVLPSGKRPVIQPVHPGKLRRIYNAYPEPPMPTILLPVKSAGMAQRIPDEHNKEYQAKRAEWFMTLQRALLTRYIVDSLVVPEDADYLDNSLPDDEKARIAMPDCPLHQEQGNAARWKRMGFSEQQIAEVDESGACTCVPAVEDWSAVLRMTGVPVPNNGIDRQWAYAEEALEELFCDMSSQVAFTAAVRSISIPTEAGIEAARRRFRDQMARATASGDKATEGGDQGSAGA